LLGLSLNEAKKPDLPDTEGLAQAKKYAEKLKTRFGAIPFEDNSST
jgi:hypothetical protein